MNTIESILSQLTSDALASDLKTVLREQDPEFPPVESAFKEATCALASRIGKEEVEELLAAKEQQILSDLVYAAYIRFMASFSDGLQTYQEDENGTPRYFWMLLDEVLHFITDHKVKPFIGLGYMPSKLAAADTPSPFHWKANISGPKSYKKWENYLKAFLKHLVHLFSYDVVCSWRFEFWNDPIMPDAFWHDSPEAFREFFLVSYRAFRAVLPDGQFGSPGFVYIEQYREAESFLAFCMRNGVRFDFLH